MSQPDAVIRRALRISVPYNLGGALLFAFANSIGRFVDLPGPVPPVFSATIAFLVALFAATYWWLARQPQIDRPLVGFCAIGKAGVFTVVLVCWRLGDAPFAAVLAAVGDLVLAGIFAWWLLRGARPAAAV